MSSKFNRKNIDGVRFVDFDKISLMEIIPIEFVKENEAKERVLKQGFRVDAVTDTGFRIENLYSDKQSGTDKMCLKFISDNWINAKK